MKKKYDNSKFTEDEKYVMGAFERFFTFEFYVRYLRQHHSRDLHRIQLLKNFIRKKFIELNTVNKLSQCKFKFPDDPENSYPLDIKLEELVNWTLNGLQRSHISLDDLNYDLDYGGLRFSEKAKEHLLTPFNVLKKYVKPSQKSLAYCFSDLVNPNDIYSVFCWWCNHIDCKPNTKKNGIRNIATITRELKLNNDGSYSPYTHMEQEPFRSPTVFVYTDEDTYCICSSNNHSIKIDGQELSNTVVFSVKFDRDLRHFYEALDDFLLTLRADQSRWYLNQLTSKVHPGFELFDPAPYLETKLKCNYSHPRH